MDLVVARYNEPLDWLDHLPDGLNVHVYNKGEPIDRPHVQLENIGRESHTYLTHIIQNYDRLAQFTIFVQGYPFDHNETTKDHEATPERIHEWLTRWKNELYHYGYTKYVYAIRRSRDWRCPVEHVTLQPLTLGEWASVYIDKDVGFPRLAMYVGACFGVKRDLIHSRPKEYYQRLLETLTTDNPEEGYFMETFWVYIFNILKLRHDGVLWCPIRWCLRLQARLENLGNGP